MMIGKWAIATTVTAATVLGALAAPAGAISLGFLASSNGTLETADKIFSDFVCDISTDLPTNTPLSCDDIDISVLPVGSGNGLKLTGNLFAAENSFLDVLFQYTVTAKPGTADIQSIGLSLNGQVLGVDGFAGITETVTDPETGEELGFLVVDAFGDFSDPEFEIGQDIPLIHPVRRARVEKDMLVRNGALITMATQTYEESIPEPATGAALLALGSWGIGSILKRNSQKKL